MSEYKQTVDYRTSYPMTVNYLYDSLDRVTEVHYPAQYGLAGNPRKVVENSYDSASRLSEMKYDGAKQASDIVYNASDQTTSVKIGVTGANQVTENYTFDPQTGLLTNQTAVKGSTALLDLSYDYDKGGSGGGLSGKTGALTKIVNNLDTNKNREYEYDALGRLTKAKGGATGTLWQQTYTYDRYGNRTNVAATGTAADSSPIPLDGIPNLSYDNATNRITTTGFEYDAAGNQTRSLAADGVHWLLYEYDAANRLQAVKQDGTTPTDLQGFFYGSTNAKLMDHDLVNGQLKIFASVGGSVLAEYTEYTSTVPTWTKSYTYFGDTQLATVTPNGSGGEYIEFNHPDRLGTRLITNQAGGTSYEQTHLPFGTALNAESTGSTNNRFTSYDRSAPTGLDYALNRTYDSKLGRFTQVDPIRMGDSSLVNPQSFNLYSYCQNDPINHLDPSGLGFFSFLKKLFKWVAEVFKWVAIVVTVAVIVLGIMASHGMLSMFFTKLLGVLAELSNFVGAASFQTFAADGMITIASVGIGVGSYIAAGLATIGAIANSFASSNGPPPPQDPPDCNDHILSLMFVKDGSSDPNDPNKAAIPYVNSEISDALAGALIEMDQKKIDFAVSEMFRDRARQQYLYDHRNANSNPVAKPGTSNHESGYAFDVPAKFRTATVDKILKKYGFRKLSGGVDPPHYEWKNAPQGAERIKSNAKFNAWYLKCVKGQK